MALGERRNPTHDARSARADCDSWIDYPWLFQIQPLPNQCISFRTLSQAGYDPAAKRIREKTVENVNQPRERQAAKGDPSTTEAQPDMPKRQEPERSPGHFKTAGSKERPAEGTDLSDELERCRTQLRDYEQMLVARIGDVDGDFRATTLRLQRVQRTQHDALDKRVQRHAWILGGLMLFAALCVIALFLVYRQSASESSRVAAEVSEIHRRLAGLSEEQGIQAQVRERPDQVATQIAAAAAASGESDKGEEPTAQASSATTGQTPGKGGGAEGPRP